jgi:hypothetical protein
VIAFTIRGATLDPDGMVVELHDDTDVPARRPRARRRRSSAGTRARRSRAERHRGRARRPAGEDRGTQAGQLKTKPPAPPVIAGVTDRGKGSPARLAAGAKAAETRRKKAALAAAA